MADTSRNASGERPATDALIESVGIEQLADILRAAGYRVSVAQQGDAVQLMSAAQGVGFTVRFGNALAQGRQVSPDAARYIDYTLSCVLQVQGELPPELVANWNRTKRFARLAAHGPFLALEMDAVVAGGVSERHLRSTIELWDRLLQQFLLHLRNRQDPTPPDAGPSATPGDSSQSADDAPVSGPGERAKAVGQ